MLDEKKIRLMKDLALYESGKGADDLKICEYFRSDYISMNCISGFLWVTVGYVILVVVLGFCGLDYLMEHMTTPVLMTLAVAVIAGYVAMIICYLIIMNILYGRKYDKAKEGVKHYKYRLMKLEEIYKKGDRRHE